MKAPRDGRRNLPERPRRPHARLAERRSRELAFRNAVRASFRLRARRAGKLGVLFRRNYRFPMAKILSSKPFAAALAVLLILLAAPAFADEALIKPVPVPDLSKLPADKAKEIRDARI